MRQLFDFCRCLRFEISARSIRVNISVTKCCFWFRNRYQKYRKRNTCSNFWSARLPVNKILTKLLKNVSSFGYNHANLLSIVTLSVEHFHSTTHVKNMLMTQLQYTREFMRSIKEALKRCHPLSACYFTSRKARWYPPTENDINIRDISPILPSKAVASSITVADDETLWI